MSRQSLRTVMLMITTKCNNSCAFCLNIGNIPQVREELSISEWLKVFNYLKKHTSVKHLIFAERELFDKPGIEQLIEIGGKQGFRLQVRTGGSDSLTPEIARFCAPYIQHIAVSYHGIESILGSKTHERQIKLLELIRDIFIPAGVGVTVSTSITRKHAGKIYQITDEIAALLDRKKVIFQKDDHLAIQYQSTTKSQHEPAIIQNFVQPCLQGGMLKHRDDLAWTMEQDGHIFDETERQLISDHRCSRRPRRILEYSLLPNGRPCGLGTHGTQGAAGLNRLTIRWDGEVVPCCASYRYTYGNVLEQDINDLWDHSYKSMRVPEIVNAYTIWKAYGRDDTCSYGQNAAYVEGQIEESIIEQCSLYVNEWHQALNDAQLSHPGQ